MHWATEGFIELCYQSIAILIANYTKRLQNQHVSKALGHTPQYCAEQHLLDIDHGCILEKKHGKKRLGRAMSLLHTPMTKRKGLPDNLRLGE